MVERTVAELGRLDVLVSAAVYSDREMFVTANMEGFRKTIDVTARRLTRGDRVIELTRTEFGLLELLLRNAEQVISYDVIRERVWGYGEAPASNALQVFVGFLRRKLEDGGGPRLLHNVRGVGYVIRTAP